MSEIQDATSFGLLGMGRTGIAMCNFLASRDYRVVATDSRIDLELVGLDARVEKRLGGHDLHDVEIAVVSPGLSPKLAIFNELEIPVVPAIEVAYELGRCNQFIGVTGTDGKTTTTELITHILTESKVKTIAAGNIGIPLAEVVDGDYEVIVAEVSAFQLWSTRTFRCPISVFTNIAEDHVDYFETFDEYVSAKRKLIEFSTEHDIGVFNASDDIVSTWSVDFPGAAMLYGLSKPQGGTHSMWLENDELMLDGNVFLERAQIPMVGVHNALNVMAATLATTAYGVSADDIRAAIQTFKPAAHRLQYLGSKLGVHFYDDSKATNAHAAIAGLNNLPSGLVAIVGGVDKGLDLKPFAHVLKEVSSHIVVIGAIQDRLTAVLRDVGVDPTRVSRCATLNDAVAIAVDKSSPSGTVVLSPACSSFDMFESYADRGRQFQAAVDAL